jgi:hypothetical protein
MLSLLGSREYLIDSGCSYPETMLRAVPLPILLKSELLSSTLSKFIAIRLPAALLILFA